MHDADIVDDADEVATREASGGWLYAEKQGSGWKSPRSYADHEQRRRSEHGRHW